MNSTATKKIVITGVLMAMNIIMSSSMLSIPVPGGHMYLNDVIIVTAAVLLDPFYAFCVGGIGAFLGDLFFYPTPMFVSLAVHGLQAVVISLCAHKLFGNKKPVAASVIGAVIGWIITFTGYTLGRAFVYATPAAAIAKLPFQILQTAVGSALALLLCWKAGIVKLYHRILEE
ncbi:MAG: ECF transporter S component [Lachnospiraceae bacterium]|nr:ECF transporter S component [Lachnospiraceae bacterium]